MNQTLLKKFKKKKPIKINREIRRYGGFLSLQFCDDLFGHLNDPRNTQGRSWKTCGPFLKAVALSLACGCKGLQEAEEMTKDMFPSVRKLLGIPKRIPDTTLRDFLCKVDPEQLSNLIYVAGYDAWRRKALHSREGFPFHVISCDGKYPTLRDIGESKTKGYKKSKYLQVHHDPEGNKHYGMMRTVNSALITAEGCPLLGSVPVPGQTSEQVTFKKALGDLVRIYGKLFRLLMYDAGAASKKNADLVRKVGKHYFFHIANENWTMYQTMTLLLKDEEYVIQDEKIISAREKIVYRMSLASVRETRKNLVMWGHARTIFKVYSEHYVDGQLKSKETRYFITSMDASELPPEKWLELIILRWRVETVHQILDLPSIFQEDDRPWITSDARGALSVMLLRRLVYTLMTLFKHVTLRSEDNHMMLWRQFMKKIRKVLEWPNTAEFIGLRTRKFAVSPALA